MNKTTQRKRRHARVRAKVKGTTARPRLSVFKSSKHIYAQIIDDEKAETLVASSDKNSNGSGGLPSLEAAKQVGFDIAERAKKKGVSKVVFDRGGFVYAGAVKVLAEAARAKGLSF